jgi:hypothetical protein
MSNKKSWGDVSSDEDSDDERVTRAPLTRPVAPDDDGVGGEDDYADERYAHPPPVVIEGPPYTAFLGNLSYDIRSSTDLTSELESLLRELRLDDVAKVKTARLVTDRPTGQSRGYGYVEFEAKEEVRFFLVVAKQCGSKIFGRSSFRFAYCCIISLSPPFSFSTCHFGNWIFHNNMLYALSSCSHSSPLWIC